MKAPILTLTAVVMLPLQLVAGSDEPSQRARFLVDPPPPLVAHGNHLKVQIDDHKEDSTIANSHQGLTRKYLYGHTLFETDLVWTADGHLVATHDLNAWTEDFVYEGEVPHPTLEQYQDATMCYGLTQMTIPSLNRWLRNHPGAYIVTDIKWRNPEGMEYLVSVDPELARKRYIPQLMSFSDYEIAHELGFERVILTLYQLNEEERKDSAIIEFAKSHDLYALTMPLERAQTTSLARTLQQELGLHVYVHPFGFGGRDYNDWLREYSEKGVSGFYTYWGNPWDRPSEPVEPVSVPHECPSRIRAKEARAQAD
jgi:glycerophosphoryl diester phosphodiesterase